MEFLYKGIVRLGITDIDDIWEIIVSNIENRQYIKEQEQRKKQIELFNNRFNVPHGLSKKEYEILVDETNVVIASIKEKTRADPYNPITQKELAGYIEKKKKINNQLKFLKKNKNNTLDIEKAKMYPIDQLLEFNTAGFTSCPFHGPERTPSAKLYRHRNKLHCFGCSVDADAIDIYKKINNVTFNEAVQRLTN